MNISKILILSIILLSGCNGQVQKQQQEQETATPAKPCSREDVKKEVISLFESEFKSIDSTYIGYSKILNDSLGDIISNQKNDNTCNCEATIYYSYSNRDYTSEQKKQLDSINNLIPILNDQLQKIVSSGGTTINNGKGSIIVDYGHVADSLDYIHKKLDKQYSQIHDNPKGWSEPKSSKRAIKYEVKISDDGKAYVELYK